MRELGESTPKVMLEVAGKPLLQHKLDALPDVVDEVVIVVGYLGGVIQRYFGGEYNGRRILYAEQENPTGGTAEALWKAQGILDKKFIAMNGDDLYAAKDIESCMQYEWAMLVQERDPLCTGGKVITDAHHRIRSIEEGTHRGKGFINAGLYVLDTRFFKLPMVPKAPGSAEYGLPQTMMQAARDIHITAVPATFWLQITAPEDLQKAEEILEHSPAI